MRALLLVFDLVCSLAGVAWAAPAVYLVLMRFASTHSFHVSA